MINKNNHSKNFLTTLLIVMLLVLSTLFLGSCLGSSENETEDKKSEQKKEEDSEKEEDEKKAADFPGRISANFPVDIAFTEDTMFFIEKGGRLKSVARGEGTTKTLREIDVPSPVGYDEVGLLGIALSPDFDDNNEIYLFHTYSEGGQLFNRVVKVRADEPEAEPVVIINGISGNRIHDAGKLAFGPDGMLYIATGDANDKPSAQDTDDLNGKVLRISPNGSIPDDNPFGNAVWSYGHRNIFGMTFDDEGRLFITENGPDKNDEVNEIIKGDNYGWPTVTGEDDDFTDPVVTFSQSIAPTGIIDFKGDKHPEIENGLIIADFINGELRLIKLDNGSEEVVEETGKGINGLAESPDGYIYIATENEIRRLDQ